VFRLHPLKQNQEFTEARQELRQTYLHSQDGKGENEAKYKDSNLFELVVRETSNQEVGTILIESELKLMLLRHWSLYESIYNSNYTVSKLTLWKEQNQKRFRDLLIKIAVPIDQAKQKYEYMNVDLRKDLKRKILEKSAEFNLEKILQSSYVR
jgi:hypothetical protein